MPRRDLIVASIFFAAYWTIAMVLVTAPGAAAATILGAAGAIVGAFWCVGMWWWVKRQP